MCTQPNVDIDCCWPCSAVDDGKNVCVTILVQVSTFHLVPSIIMSGLSPPIPHIQEPINQILLHNTQRSCYSIKKTSKVETPTPVAARCKALVWGRSILGFPGWNPAGGMEDCCECWVLLVRGLCVGLIIWPEDSYRVWWVWVWSGATVIFCTYSE